MRTIASATAAAVLLTGCAPGGPDGPRQAADGRPAAYPYLQAASPGPADRSTPTAPASPSAEAFTVLATGDTWPARASLAGIQPALTSADLTLCPAAPRPPAARPHRPHAQRPGSGRRRVSFAGRVVRLAPGGLGECLDGSGVRVVRGVTVAVVAAAPGRSPKALGEILAAAHEARQAGAKVVIVGLRWGTAYRHGANPGQVALAQRLLASPDIDLLVGHGAHVVQPYARALNGKWVAYGLGDLTGREALLGRFTFGLRKDRWTVARAGFTPTVLDHGRVLDVPAELAGPGVSPSRRAALKAVQDRTAKIVYSRHTLPALTG